MSSVDLNKKEMEKDKSNWILLTAHETGNIVLWKFNNLIPISIVHLENTFIQYKLS